MKKEITMKNIITTIALSTSLAMVSGVAMAGSGHHVTVNTGLQSTLALLAQQAENGSALNLAINTGNIDATVNTKGGFNTLDGIGESIAIETSAIGAVNTGNIDLEQGSMSTVNMGSLSKDFAANLSGWKEVDGGHHFPDMSAGVEGAVSAAVDTEYYQEFAGTLSNYAAANLAFNSGSVDASVNTQGFKNAITGIKTSAIGAANTGNITVTVK